MTYNYDHIIKLLINNHGWTQIPLYRGNHVLN